jgi:hypothetical protein
MLALLIGDAEGGEGRGAGGGIAAIHVQVSHAGVIPITLITRPLSEATHAPLLLS